MSFLFYRATLRKRNNSTASASVDRSVSVTLVRSVMNNGDTNHQVDNLITPIYFAADIFAKLRRVDSQLGRQIGYERFAIFHQYVAIFE